MLKRQNPSIILKSRRRRREVTGCSCYFSSNKEKCSTPYIFFLLFIFQIMVRWWYYTEYTILHQKRTIAALDSNLFSVILYYSFYDIWTNQQRKNMCKEWKKEYKKKMNVKGCVLIWTRTETHKKGGCKKCKGITHTCSRQVFCKHFNLCWIIFLLGN